MNTPARVTVEPGRSDGTRPGKAVGATAVILAVAGLATMIVLGGWDVWPPLVGWSVGTAVCVAALGVLRGNRLAATSLSVAVVIATVLLGWVGGLFMLPAALIGVVWSLMCPSPRVNPRVNIGGVT